MKNSVLSTFQRHPFAVNAYFQRSLVLTYALPASFLEPLVGPGLELDTFGDFGFLAIAMVDTKDLRPKGFPRVFGRDFFLSGYRIFTRFVRPGRATLRGLRILRSDTNRKSMTVVGNWLTRYRYRQASVSQTLSDDVFTVQIRTPNREADLHVEAQLGTRPAPLPEGSPFQSMEEARKFAGPLPFTFSYDAERKKMVVVKGVRKKWDPQPVSVRVHEATFLTQPPYAGVKATLANAFYLEDVPYSWERGKLEDI